MDTGQKIRMTHPVVERLVNTYPEERVIRIKEILRHFCGVSRKDL
jgi:uncharacterized membrane protein YfbV (UPF0208 family)